jgi:hypothetical protein
MCSGVWFLKSWCNRLLLAFGLLVLCSCHLLAAHVSSVAFYLSHLSIVLLPCFNFILCLAYIFLVALKSFSEAVTVNLWSIISVSWYYIFLFMRSLGYGFATLSQRLAEDPLCGVCFLLCSMSGCSQRFPFPIPFQFL